MRSPRPTAASVSGLTVPAAVSSAFLRPRGGGRRSDASRSVYAASGDTALWSDPSCGGDTRPRCSSLHHSLVTRSSAGAAHARGAAVVTWTVDDLVDPRACGRGGSRCRGDERSSVYSRLHWKREGRPPFLSGAPPARRLRAHRLRGRVRARCEGGRGNRRTPRRRPSRPTTTQPTDAAADGATRSSLRRNAPAPIAFGVTVGGVRVGGLMPYQARKAVDEGIRRARCGSSSTTTHTDRRSRLHALGAKPNVAEGRSGARASRGRARSCRSTSRSRRLACAGTSNASADDVDRDARSTRASSLDGVKSARRRVAGGSSPQAARRRVVRSGPRSRRTAARRSACRYDDHEAEGRRRPSSTRPSSSSAARTSLLFFDDGEVRPLVRRRDRASPRTRRRSATTRS